MKRVLSIVLMLLFAATLTANAAPATTKAPVVKEWTVAVFLNADNNLDPFGLEDQKEMSRVGSNDYMNIVTLIDRERGPAQINYIQKNKIVKIKDLGELDMGDYREFVKFVKFIKENYPAKHYSFTFWNHGSGWKNKNENAVFRGISYDDSSNNHITNNQLTIATREAEKILGQKIDILNFDACLMQMVEVAHAVKDHVNFMVASEELEPGKGAPYDDILMGVKKGMNPKQFAVNWVNAFYKSYNNGSQGYDDSTQSALDLSKLPAVIDSLNGIAKTVMSGKYASVFKEPLLLVQKFDYPENIDLIHFLELLKPFAEKDVSLKTAVDKALAATKAMVVANKTTGSGLKNSKGVAIYLPVSYRVEQKYMTLNFAKQTMWAEMITALAKRDVIDTLVADVKAGKMAELRKFVTAAKKNPKNDLYRMGLRELNYISTTEKSVPKRSEESFNKLLAELKEALTRR
jgi:hypothetical protein